MIIYDLQDPQGHLYDVDNGETVLAVPLAQLFISLNVFSSPNSYHACRLVPLSFDSSSWDPVRIFSLFCLWFVLTTSALAARSTLP